jgi:hypothetical protein
MRRLYKDETSGGGGCPSVYAEDGTFVVVGDQAETAGISDLLPGETAVRVPEEVLVGGVEEHIGRPVRRDATPIEPFSPAWDAMLRGFNHTAFRLETLQHYEMPYEDMRRFLDGQHPHDDASLDEWLKVVRDARDAGKRMERVHVVVEPLSDYLRYELVRWYAANVAAGEEIGIIPVRQGQWPAGLPKHDFWLYYSSRVGILHYDPEGHLYRAELVRDPVEVVRHNAWRDIAMHQAISVADYLDRHPDLRARLIRERESAGNVPASA